MVSRIQREEKKVDWNFTHARPRIAESSSGPTVDISPNLSRKTNSNCGPEIPMRLCIIDYAPPRITFTVPWKCTPLPSSPSGGRKPTRFTIVNERRSRPTNPYNNLAPVHRPAYVEMLANRGESVRKLVELQPLPVIKSKERRRYGRRASAAVEYEKGAGRGARIILSQCLNEDAYIRSCTSGHDHHHQHVFIEIHLN